MSKTVDLINDCSAILSCLPQLRVIDVLDILQTYSSEQRNQRIRLTLKDIFNEQDKKDSAIAQQNDTVLVHNLLPDIEKGKVSSLMCHFGNDENRKAMVLRLLLQDSVIDVKANKHKLTEGVISTSVSIEDNQQKKRRITGDDLAKDFDSCNNNIVIESGACNLNKANTNKNNSVVNNRVDKGNNSTDNVVCVVPNIHQNIFRPSTSRAVWNPYSGNYEEDSVRMVVRCDKIANANDTPRAESNYAEEAENIVDVDWSEEFPSSTTQQEVANPKNVHSSVISVEEENIETSYGSTTDVTQIQNGSVGNESLEEKNSTKSCSVTGAKDRSESISSSDSVVEVMEVPTPSFKNPIEVDNRLLYPLMEMFPQACPDYLRRLCANMEFSEDILNELSMRLLSSDDYPQRERPITPEEKLDPDEQFEILAQVLPDADPTFLRMQCEQLADNPDALKQFISDALENKNYPTMKEYLRKQQLSAQQKQYTTEFKVSKFLEVIPDPVTYFEDPQRQVQIPVADMHFVYTFLRNEFCSLPIATIKSGTIAQDCGLLKVYRNLENIVKNKSVQLLRAKRKRVPLAENCQNIPLLQEMAYITHKEEILNYMKEQRKNEELERQCAKENGLLRTCNCCFDDEILEKNIVTCDNGCVFCKQCVQKSVEVAFGSGKLEFGCLTDCPSHFNLQTLQSAVNPKLFSKLAQKKQMEEVKAAGIEDLEVCPFCDFATIPAENDKLFRCLNPECMKESCRQCKEPSHIPLKCNEVEKDEDVKRRTYIENKMSEALLRKCHRCGKCFIKSDGCNKITCTCGATQCYLCGKPVNGYDHFNGQGGDKYHLCPLYSDTETLHEQAVLRGAETAKAEIGVETKELKIDPTADIRNHYSELKKKSAPLPPRANIANVGIVQHNYAAVHPIVFPANRPVVAALNQHHHHHHFIQYVQYHQLQRQHRHHHIPQPPIHPNDQLPHH